MRTIDADALYKKLNDIRKEEILLHGRMNNKYCCTLSTALYEIENAPTIEPEIIRCKDCRKHNVSSGYKNDCCPLYEWRGISYGHEHDYQYCCFAERRPDEGD